MIVLLLAAAAVLTDATVAPLPVKPAPRPLTYAPAKAVDAKPDQLVCKSEPVLGSRMPVRRCHTVADIAERQLQDRQAIEHAQIVQEPSK